MIFTNLTSEDHRHQKGETLADRSNLVGGCNFMAMIMLYFLQFQSSHALIY